VAETDKTVADRLRALQQDRGFSVADLARAAGSSEGAIRQLLNGTTKMPSLLTALRLADMFGVTAWYIAIGRDSGPRETPPRSLASLIAAQEHQELEIVALSRRVSTLEDRVGGDRRRTAPRSR
jgi:transcriptional regulator with XRE-family HTH domain